MSWPCSTGQEAQVQPWWCNKTRPMRMSHGKGRKLQTSSLQSIIEVLPDGEKFTSAPCSGQNMDVLLMEVQPSPILHVQHFLWLWHSWFWAGNRLEWHSSTLHSMSKNCCLCLYNLWSYRGTVPPQKVTARTWAVPSTPEAALGGRKGQFGRTKLSSEPFTIQHA